MSNSKLNREAEKDRHALRIASEMLAHARANDRIDVSVALLSRLHDIATRGPSMHRGAVVSGVHLYHHESADPDAVRELVVAVEVDGEWRSIIREIEDGHISHTAELPAILEAGISKAHRNVRCICPPPTNAETLTHDKDCPFVDPLNAIEHVKRLR